MFVLFLQGGSYHPIVLLTTLIKRNIIRELKISRINILMEEVEKRHINKEYKIIKNVRFNTNLPDKTIGGIINFMKSEEDALSNDDRCSLCIRSHFEHRFMGSGGSPIISTPLIPYALLSGRKTLEEIIEERKKWERVPQMVYPGISKNQLIESITDINGFYGPRSFFEIASEIKEELINFIKKSSYPYPVVEFHLNPIHLDDMGCIRLPTVNCLSWSENKILIFPPEFSSKIKLKDIDADSTGHLVNWHGWNGVRMYIDQKGWRIEFQKE